MLRRNGVIRLHPYQLQNLSYFQVMIKHFVGSVQLQFLYRCVSVM